jgi:tRNA/tmRNA/rRNA uracil-C5-methylase (TrmA/RlmC/RlmD family)
VLDSFSTDLEKEVKKQTEIYPGWYKTQPKIPLDEVVISSDMIDAYRNKVEFTVGRQYSSEGLGKICVGFNRGNLSKGITFVDIPDDIRVNSKESIIVCKRFQTIVEDFEAEYSPYNRTANEGFWRILLYRESRETKQVLISVVVS